MLYFLEIPPAPPELKATPSPPLQGEIRFHVELGILDRPILQLNKQDKRFVASHDVAYELDDSYNLAAMDWLDFENLIREIFEKEFRTNGGEVKITRASRDGGVDAIAFDPDPIRGGKIVIQAKRYTNNVGVSAVRDLFGTVHNEGHPCHDLNIWAVRL